MPIIFGNPKGGTPLMLANSNVAIDLPLKVLVFEQDGQAFVQMQDVNALAATHNLDATTPPLRNITGALEALKTAATH